MRVITVDCTTGAQVTGDVPDPPAALEPAPGSGPAVSPGDARRAALLATVQAAAAADPAYAALARLLGVLPDPPNPSPAADPVPSAESPPPAAAAPAAPGAA